MLHNVSKMFKLDYELEIFMSFFLRTEIDLNECEHFFYQFQIDPKSDGSYI